eukprot:205235-Pelagomonas_calceolata.AAC.2
MSSRTCTLSVLACFLCKQPTALPKADVPAAVPKAVVPAAQVCKGIIAELHKSARCSQCWAVMFIPHMAASQHHAHTHQRASKAFKQAQVMDADHTQLMGGQIPKVHSVDATVWFLRAVAMHREMRPWKIRSRTGVKSLAL